MTRYTIRFTKAAERDLAALYEFLFTKGSPEVAERVLGEIEQRIGALDRSPLRGAVPQELLLTGGRKVRQIVVGKYRVFYRVTETDVVVILVSDGRRDMAALLRDRLLSASDQG